MDKNQQTSSIGAYSNLIHIFKNIIDNMRRDMRKADKGEMITINNISSVLSQLQNMINNTLCNMGYEVTITMSTLNESVKPYNKVRLSESDLHNIVKESVEQVLMEIGDTERGQYALGALQAKKDYLAKQEFQRGCQFNNKYSTYKPDVHASERRKEVNGGSEFDTTNMENYYKAKDMYNAYLQGLRNYRSSMNNPAAEDYRTAKIRH